MWTPPLFAEHLHQHCKYGLCRPRINLADTPDETALIDAPYLVKGNLAFASLQTHRPRATDTSVTLRRTHFRVADDLAKCAAIARQIVAGKIQNSRNGRLRAAREAEAATDREQLQTVIDTLGRRLPDLLQQSDRDTLRPPQRWKHHR